MRLELTGRHVTITPALRRLVDQKIAKLERLLNDSAVSAQAVLSRERHRHRAEITVHARGEHFLHGVGDATTWEMSVCEAMDKIAQQAHKVKGKWQERKRRGRKTAALAPMSPRGDESRRGPSIDATSRVVRPRMPRIFRASRQAIKAMSVAEAAREIDVNGDGLVVFRDAETSSITVLYRQRNGELTLVETEA